MEVFYFSTATCGPCKTFWPVCQEFFANRDLDIQKVDIEEEDNLHYIMDYSIKSVPTVVVVENGEVVFKSVGARMEELKKIDG